MKLSILAAYFRGVLDSQHEEGDPPLTEIFTSDFDVIKYMSSCPDCDEQLYNNADLRRIVKHSDCIEEFLAVIGYAMERHQPNPRPEDFVPSVDDRPIGVQQQNQNVLPYGSQN